MFIHFGKLDQRASMNQEGTGLGLSICKRIVETKGGSVRVNSVVDEGTSFTVNLCARMRAKKKLIDKLIGKDGYDGERKQSVSLELLHYGMNQDESISVSESSSFAEESIDQL